METFEKLRALKFKPSSQSGLLRYLLETVAGCTTNQQSWSISQRDLADRLAIPLGTLRRVVARAVALELIRVEQTTTRDGRGWLAYSLDWSGIEATIQRAASATNVRSTDSQPAQPAQSACAASAASVRSVRERVFKVPFHPNVQPGWQQVVAELKQRGVRRAAELAKQVAASGAAPEKLLAIIQEFDRRRAPSWPSPEGVLHNRCIGWHVPADSAWPFTPGSDKPAADPYLNAEAEKYRTIKKLKSQGLGHAEAVEQAIATVP